jgi:hypothetical protein
LDAWILQDRLGRPGEGRLGVLTAVCSGQFRFNGVVRNQLCAGIQQDVGLHVDVAVVQADGGKTQGWWY